MNAEQKRLAWIAAICFFPTALVGFKTFKSDPERGMYWFRLTMVVWFIGWFITAIVIYTKGGGLIEALGSIY